jgi:hypothetical protein
MAAERGARVLRAKGKAGGGKVGAQLRRTLTAMQESENAQS